MPRNPDKIDYSGGLPEQLKAFDVIEDPRTGGNTKHHFGEVLFISVVGLLCGMNTCADIEDFAHLQRDWFNKWLEPDLTRMTASRPLATEMVIPLS